MGTYQYKYSVAIKQMIKDRTLLAEDAATILDAGMQRVVGLLPAAPPQ